MLAPHNDMTNTTYMHIIQCNLGLMSLKTRLTQEPNDDEDLTRCKKVKVKVVDLYSTSTQNVS